MDQIKEHFPLLEFLCQCSKSHRSLIINRANSKLINCLCECALNVLSGNVPLTQEEKKKKTLKRYRHTLRQLCQRKVPIKQKKKILTQQGGGTVLKSMLEAVFRLL